MSKRVIVDLRKKVSNMLAQMLCDYLLTTLFPDMSITEMSKRLNLSETIVNTPWWGDIPELAERSGLNLGLVLRDAKGNEVTLFPADNFSQLQREPKIAQKNYGIGYKPSRR